MRASAVSLLLPLLARAADVELLGMDYQGGEAVKAGDEITLKITNSTEAGSGYPGATVSHIRIVVWNTINRANQCSLTGILPAEDGEVKVTIPSEMGPSGMYYQISAEGYSNPTNDSWDNIIAGDHTPIFYFTGGQGSWTPAEVAEEIRFEGLGGFGSADIPCKSYGCAQKCANKQFPPNSGWTPDSEWIKCLTACDGVTLNTEDMPRSSTQDIQLPSSVDTPSEECKEEDLHTKCGTDCCTSAEYCLNYEGCALLPLRLSHRPTTTSATGTARETGAPKSSTQGSPKGTGTADSSTVGTPQNTGAANSVSVDWRMAGMVAGAFGVVGAGM